MPPALHHQPPGAVVRARAPLLSPPQNGAQSALPGPRAMSLELCMLSPMETRDHASVLWSLGQCCTGLDLTAVELFVPQEHCWGLLRGSRNTRALCHQVQVETDHQGWAAQQAGDPGPCQLRDPLSQAPRVRLVSWIPRHSSCPLRLLPLMNSSTRCPGHSYS